MCVTHIYMNTYNVCDTYMGKQGARSILALVQVGLLAQASTPAVVAVALTMIMVVGWDGDDHGGDDADDVDEEEGRISTKQ